MNNNNSQNISDKNFREMQRRRALAQRKKLRRQKIEQIKAVAIFALAGTLICLAVIFGCIFHDFFEKSENSTLPVKITLGGDEPVFLEDDSFFFRDGEYYVSLTALSSLTDFTIHGRADQSMTLAVDGKDAFSFDVETSKVLCGGKWSVMSNRSVFEKEQLFVPASFFPTFFEGVKNEYNSKGKKEGFNIIFDSTFSPSHSVDNGTPSLPHGALTELNALKKPEFITDLSEYEMYMNPENRDEYLVLINETHPLASDYIPEDLTPVINTRNDREKQKMRLYAAKALEALYIEMKANGFTDVSVTSAYRSYEYQSQLFNTRVNAIIGTYGKEKATAIVKEGTALPGTSEHQSGLCADMHNLSAASEAFAAKEAYRWLYANCAEFGFILRYPKNKTDITGIMFEPWHYRYVGRYHARKIMDSGVCLEEYMANLGQ